MAKEAKRRIRASKQMSACERSSSCSDCVRGLQLNRHSIHTRAHSEQENTIVFNLQATPTHAPAGYGEKSLHRQLSRTLPSPRPARPSPPRPPCPSLSLLRGCRWYSFGLGRRRGARLLRKRSGSGACRWRCVAVVRGRCSRVAGARASPHCPATLRRAAAAAAATSAAVAEVSAAAAAAQAPPRPCARSLASVRRST